MSGKRSIFWQLYPSYLLITLISLVAVTWYASSAIRHFYLEQAASDLEACAHLFEGQITRYLDPLQAHEIDQLTKRAGGRATTRITVVLPTGKVVGDSDQDPDYGHQRVCGDAS